MKSILSRLLALISLTILCHGHPSLPADDGNASSSGAKQVRIEHEQRKIEGWTVFVDQSLLSGKHEKHGALALKILGQRLHRIVMRLPEEPRKAMQQVSIYVDRAHPLGNAHFHPNKGWLVDHGYDPALTETVHLTSANILVGGASQPDRGSVVLHELAHAYHFQVLGFDHPGILEAYRVFCDSEKFDSVTYANGRLRPHYGLMDHKEFFAEMTETFFADNNSFPFNRTELMLYHPETYQSMAEIWGVKVPKPRGKWSEDPTAWDLRMLATLKAQRGQYEEALELVAKAKELEPNNERLDTLQERLQRQSKKAE